MAKVSDMETNPSAEYSAHAALQDAADARERSAARTVTPWWYHPTIGLALVLIVVGVAVAPEAQIVFWALASIALSLAASFAYRRLTGIWVGPAQTGPRSRPVWIAFAATLLAALGAAGAIRVTEGPPWLTALLAVVVFLATVILGRRTDAALRADIRAGDTTLQVH